MVDGSTEFFNGSSWRPVAELEEGEDLYGKTCLQYNKGYLELVRPLRSFRRYTSDSEWLQYRGIDLDIQATKNQKILFRFVNDNKDYFTTYSELENAVCIDQEPLITSCLFKGFTSTKDAVPEGFLEFYCLLAKYEASWLEDHCIFKRVFKDYTFLQKNNLRYLSFNYNQKYFSPPKILRQINKEYGTYILQVAKDSWDELKLDKFFCLYDYSVRVSQVKDELYTYYILRLPNSLESKMHYAGSSMRLDWLLAEDDLKSKVEVLLWLLSDEEPVDSSLPAPCSLDYRQRFVLDIIQLVALTVGRVCVFTDYICEGKRTLVPLISSGYSEFSAENFSSPYLNQLGYGLQVPSGSLVLRRNGKIFVIGDMDD